MVAVPGRKQKLEKVQAESHLDLVVESQLKTMELTLYHLVVGANQDSGCW